MPGATVGSTGTPGRFPLAWVDETPSTQDTLVHAAAAGDPEQALATLSQTGGRGRRGRSWECPPGSGLAVSVLLRPRRDEGWTWLPLLTGLAVARAAEHLGAPRVLLKWPNDVLLTRGGQPRKLAGILADRVEPRRSPPARRASCVLGIGLNLRRAGLPAEAAALADAVDPTVSPPHVASVLLDRLEREVTAWEAGTDPVEEYRVRCGTIGQDVTVVLPTGGRHVGRAVDVDSDGRLLLAQPATADPLPIAAGDVVHVRPG